MKIIHLVLVLLSYHSYCSEIESDTLQSPIEQSLIEAERKMFNIYEVFFDRRHFAGPVQWTLRFYMDVISVFLNIVSFTFAADSYNRFSEDEDGARSNLAMAGAASLGILLTTFFSSVLEPLYRPGIYLGSEKASQMATIPIVFLKTIATILPAINLLLTFNLPKDAILAAILMITDSVSIVLLVLVAVMLSFRTF